MSASTTPPASLSQFSADELEMLAKTADALSAYLGQAVLAEISLTDEGMEYATFGMPIDEQNDIEDQPHVQLGGPGARLVGSRGGLSPTDTDPYDCLYLWVILINTKEGERFIKLDQDGEESAWSDDLADMLPFALGEEPLSDDDDEEDDDDDDDDDDEAELGKLIHPPSPRRH